MKFINESFHNMRCLFVWLLFLLNLKWSKNKSVYDLVNTYLVPLPDLIRKFISVSVYIFC